LARILITGGAGYVGSHCAKALALAGHEAIVFDSLIQGRRDFVRWGELIIGDVRNAEVLKAVFSETRFDAVLHFAAAAYVSQSVSNPSLYYDVNVHGTRTLLQAMREAGVSKIVFSSTCAVYGDPATLPIGEKAPLSPVNPYGFSKLVCERMMDDFDAAYSLKSVRLRYFNAAGADPEGEIGEEHNPETHLIPLVLDAAMGLRRSLQVFGTDYSTHDGTAIRDYVHVNDLAAAHLAALDYLLAAGNTIALNLGTGQGVSVKELIQTAEQLTGRPVPIEIAPRRPGDPACLVADPSEAYLRLGWTPKLSNLMNVLRDALNWHQKRSSAVDLGTFPLLNHENENNLSL
jgi:UDP-arabinose 4-epimerase